MKELLRLFWAFFQVGGLTFGGGYAMLPHFQRVLVEKNGWITEEDLLDCYAVSQCTPGVIAVNTATFVGESVKGVWGAVFSTLGVVAPSFIIILILALFLDAASGLTVLQHAFGGIRIAVCAFIINAVIKLSKSAIKNIFGIIVALAAFAVTVVLGLSPVFAVLGALVLGVAAFFVKRIRRPQ